MLVDIGLASNHIKICLLPHLFLQSYFSFHAKHVQTNSRSLLEALNDADQDPNFDLGPNMIFPTILKFWSNFMLK